MTKLLKRLPVAGVMLMFAACGPKKDISSQILSATPLHETASYSLVPARSSHQVKSGSVKLTVIDQTADAYTVQADYSLVLHLLFWDQPYTGSSKLSVPAAYFTPTFWDNLAAGGIYSSGQFNAQYEGTVDAQANGETYPGAYKVKLTAPGSAPESLQNAAMEAAVKPGFPVIGAVNIDISATLNGSLPLKAGFDLSSTPD